MKGNGKVEGSGKVSADEGEAGGARKEKKEKEKDSDRGIRDTG